MGRVIAFVYGLLCFIMFWVTLLYAGAFIGNFVVPNTLDGTPRSSLAWAIVVNTGLLTAFALQHSVMARPAFKRVWTKIVPQVVERSTYVLFANVALLTMFTFWEPMGGTVWNVTNPVGRAVLYTVYAIGLTIVIVATFLINHFELFGMRQVWLYLRGREYTHLPFVTPGPYKYVRHPLYVGFMIAFWSAPTMTLSHLMFAVMTTLYILVAIQLEERDLIHFHGKRYAEYRNKTPMLVPQLTPVQLEGGTSDPASETGVV